MTNDIPNTSKWTALYTKHGAPDGGVTKAMNAYWASGANTPQKFLVAYGNLEKVMATYISKVSKDKKLKAKITDYEKFEKTFLDTFLGVAHKNRLDTERGMAGIKNYKAELIKFMAMVQKLSPTKATALDLERFKQGPARGLSAMASQARGLTKEQLTVANAIRDEVKKVDTIVDTKPANATQKQINALVKQIITVAKNIREIAVDGGMA
jgi:hypothetical protein